MFALSIAATTKASTTVTYNVFVYGSSYWASVSASGPSEYPVAHIYLNYWSSSPTEISISLQSFNYWASGWESVITSSDWNALWNSVATVCTYDNNQQEVLEGSSGPNVYFM